MGDSIELTNEELKALGFVQNRANNNLFYKRVRLHSYLEDDAVVKLVRVNFRNKTKSVTIEVVYDNNECDLIFGGKVEYLEEFERLFFRQLFSETEEEVYKQFTAA